MGKQSAWVAIQKKRWPLLILSLPSLFTRTSFDSCATNSTSSTASNSIVINNNRFGEEERDKFTNAQIHSKAAPNPLDFMKSKLVLLVSHELSLSDYSGGHAAMVGSVLVTNLKSGFRKGEWDRVEEYKENGTLVQACVNLQFARLLASMRQLYIS